MPSFLNYKRNLLDKGKTLGEVRKRQADEIILDTWDGDIQSRVGYFYDYYHDDKPLENYDLKPMECDMKVPIDIKFIPKLHNSESKDQVGYYIQFKPGQKCPLDYYYDAFVKKYQTHFPIALYVDIPDEQGIFRKWLVTEEGNWLDPQFPTWYVLPCDYLFQWIHKNKKYQMYGVGRSQNSYNQGTWMDFNFVVHLKLL